MDPEDSALLAALLRKERLAHLGTLRGGAPMASMTLYMTEGELEGTRSSGAFSAFYVHVSRLAWHTQDLLGDGRCALSIAETDDGRADPFTLMRVSIRGEASNLANAHADFASLRSAWLSRFPEQAINFELADFSFWRIAPRDARFVAGFGRIYNLSADALKNAGA
jgi:putative heme iron utilization protein